MIERAAWNVPPLFRVLQDAGRVDQAEMFDVFNMGIGMIAVVSQFNLDTVRHHAAGSGTETWVIGQIVEGSGVELVG
jgi:phosphoribosylformylglycinamidine cyclo-ligase